MERVVRILWPSGRFTHYRGERHHEVPVLNVEADATDDEDKTNFNSACIKAATSEALQELMEMTRNGQVKEGDYIQIAKSLKKIHDCIDK